MPEHIRFMYKVSFPLEEKIPVVYDIRLENKILHEVADHLHILLGRLLHYHQLVVLGTGTHRLLDNLEHIHAGIALYRSFGELAGCCCCHGARECRLDSTCCLYEGWRSKGNLIDRTYLGTLCLGSGNAADTLEFRHEQLCLLILHHLTLQDFLHLCIVPCTEALRMDGIEDDYQEKSHLRASRVP